MFDPWSCSEDEANAAQVAWIKAGGSFSDPFCPLLQASAAAQVAELQKKVEQGDGLAVVYCAHLCLSSGLVAPEWLGLAFGDRYLKVSSHLLGSWDEAFGKPLPKGRQRQAARADKIGPYAVWYLVSQILAAEPSTAVDRGLFERVGEELDIARTRAEDYYYKAINDLGFANPAQNRK